MELTVFAAREFIEMPEGVYDAKVTDIQDVTNQFYKDGEPDYRKKNYEWTFEVSYKNDDGEEKTVSLKRQTGRSDSPKGNLYKFFIGITGKSLTAGSNLSEVIGKECQVVVKKVENEGRFYMKVIEVLSAKKQSDDEPKSDSEGWLENE